MFQYFGACTGPFSKSLGNFIFSHVPITSHYFGQGNPCPPLNEESDIFALYCKFKKQFFEKHQKLSDHIYLSFCFILHSQETAGFGRFVPVNLAILTPRKHLKVYCGSESS